MTNAKNSDLEKPVDWNDWKKIYKDTIRHTQFEWDFAIDVIPEVVGLKPSQVIPQHPFTGRDGREYHMDFAIITEKVKIAIELEGYDKTNSGMGKSKKEHDAFNLRIQHLTRLGWKILTITNAQFKRDPMGYANQIRQLMLESQASETPTKIVVVPDNTELSKVIKKTGAAGFGTVILLLGILIYFLTKTGDGSISVPNNVPVSASQEVFKNCDALNRTFPGGVAQSQAAKDRKEYSNPIVNETVYNANRKLDGNDDGVMCDSK
jgi:hypothetical protein